MFLSVPSAKIKFYFHRTTQTKNKTEENLPSSVSFSPLVRSHSGHWLCMEIGYEQLLGSASPGVSGCQPAHAVCDGPGEQTRRGHLWEAWPVVKRESGQRFLEALALGFLRLSFTIPKYSLI